MRDDMFKVIVERPRWGRRHATRSKVRLDRNPERSIVGHKRFVKENARADKQLNENLAPLKRYLQKHRGRRWDDVFSEICAHLDTRSTVKVHVRDHLVDLIMIDIHVDKEGRWLGQNAWGQASKPGRWWPDLYVDPHSKIIKETASLLRKCAKADRKVAKNGGVR